MVAAGVLRGAETTTATLPRFQPGRWLPHFEKHAAEFGYRTPVDYLKGARDLVGRSGVQTFTRTNGDKLFYDSARNEFAVLKPDGVHWTYGDPGAARPLGEFAEEAPSWWRRVPRRRAGELADDLAALGYEPP